MLFVAFARALFLRWQDSKEDRVRVWHVKQEEDIDCEDRLLMILVRDPTLLYIFSFFVN